MIFRNTVRLLLTNFSNVWKALLYYFICFSLTIGVCYVVAEPIINALSNANVFSDLISIINGFFYHPDTIVKSIDDVFNTSLSVLSNNLQFTFNYIFLIVWLFFVFPFTLDLAQLAFGEVLYGFMTSKVKYSYTGRFIKNIGKSSIYSLVKYLLQFVFYAVIFGLIVLIVKIALLKSILFIFLDFLLVAITICFIAFKNTLFSCWMPAIAVLDCNVFKALKRNFSCVFKNFFNIFSNCFVLVLTAIVLNFFFSVFTFGIGIIFVLPLTAFVFVIFQMVSYFSTQGMRFYVYQDMIVSPKKFEEQEKMKELKFLI